MSLTVCTRQLLLSDVPLSVFLSLFLFLLLFVSLSFTRAFLSSSHEHTKSRNITLFSHVLALSLISFSLLSLSPSFLSLLSQCISIRLRLPFVMLALNYNSGTLLFSCRSSLFPVPNRNDRPVTQRFPAALWLYFQAASVPAINAPQCAQEERRGEEERPWRRGERG